MYSCLCSSSVTCLVVLSGFFVSCELSCLAPYPFVSQESGVYIARRFPVPLPLQVYIYIYSLEEGPPFGEFYVCKYIIRYDVIKGRKSDGITTSWSAFWYWKWCILEHFWLKPLSGLTKMRKKDHISALGCKWGKKVIPQGPKMSSLGDPFWDIFVRRWQKSRCLRGCINKYNFWSHFERLKMWKWGSRVDGSIVSHGS